MGYDLTRPGDSELAPGKARCPGPSTAELIAVDDITPPDVLLEEHYEFLGDADIAFARYTSANFLYRKTRRLHRLRVRLEIEDSYTAVDGFSPGLAFVLDQDTENLRRQCNGVKAAAKTGQTLGNYQEARIRRLHMTLDEYLGETS